MRTCKTKFPPILAIYLTVVFGFGALVSTRIHAPDAERAIAAQLQAQVQTSTAL
jgi:hypothetical protein